MLSVGASFSLAFCSTSQALTLQEAPAFELQRPCSAWAVQRVRVALARAWQEKARSTGSRLWCKLCRVLQEDALSEEPTTQRTLLCHLDSLRGWHSLAKSKAPGLLRALEEQLNPPTPPPPVDPWSV